MNDDFSTAGLAQTVVLPALTVFLIPVLGLVFFLYAQSSYDSEALSFVIAQIDEILSTP